MGILSVTDVIVRRVGLRFEMLRSLHHVVDGSPALATFMTRHRRLIPHVSSMNRNTSTTCRFVLVANGTYRWTIIVTAERLSKKVVFLCFSFFSRFITRGNVIELIDNGCSQPTKDSGDNN